MLSQRVSSGNKKQDLDNIIEKMKILRDNNASQYEYDNLFTDNGKYGWYSQSEIPF